MIRDNNVDELMYLANCIMGSRVYLERSSFIHLLAVVNKSTYFNTSKKIAESKFKPVFLSPLILSSDRQFTITRIHSEK
jgi:hypothetical protein